MKLTRLGTVLAMLAGVIAAWLILRPYVLPALERMQRSLRSLSALELLVLVLAAVLLGRAASRKG